jgi:hypothetical protein
MVPPCVPPSPLVVEPHHCRVVRLQVGHDESTRRINSPKGNSTFATSGVPSPDLLAGTENPCTTPLGCGLASHWPRQQFRDVSRQILVGSSFHSSALYAAVDALAEQIGEWQLGVVPVPRISPQGGVEIKAFGRHREVIT